MQAEKTIRYQTLKKMKRYLSILVMLAMAFGAMAANSSWSFYFYDTTTGSGGDLGTFQTTSTSNVFLLENVEITATAGFQFWIHDSSWSTSYGWYETVANTGQAYTVTTGNGAGWSSLPAGAYDITFNYTNKTVQFDVHSSGGGGTTTVKKVSILGDSYSTFYGYLTPSDNMSWYSTETTSWYSDNDVTNVNQTWWKQFFNANSDYELLVNNSYSGSTMCNSSISGMDVSTSFISRANNLGSPDVILICGGTNDWWNAGLEIGDYKYGDWTEDDKTKFRPGFAYLLNYIKNSYGDAEVYFILNDMIEGDVYNSIMTICDHYSVPVIAPQGIAKGSGHPTQAGMTTIANAVTEALVNNNYGAGNDWILYENTYYTSKPFSVTDYNPNIFVIEDYSIASGMLDSYGGFSAYIGTADWSEGYRCGTASDYTTLSSFGSYFCTQATTSASNYITAMSEGNKYRVLWDKITHQLSIENGEDEGNDWYIYANSTYNKFSSTSNEDVFTIQMSINSGDLDSYGGYYFVITPSNSTTSGYSYNEKMYCLGTYTMVSTAGCTVDRDNAWASAWGNATCVALSAGNTYTLTWNKKTHRLSIALSNGSGSGTTTSNGITYQTYPDGHALVTNIDDFMRGGDISMLNYVEALGAKFYDANGNQKDPLQIMKDNGVNTVRLRLYNNPGNSVSYTVNGMTYNYALPSGFLDENDILSLAQRAKSYGMKIELTFHYSDFWTNGEMQFKPDAWKNYNFNQLKTAVYNYTYDFLAKMNAQGTTPDYVSIGNEVQSGLLFGHYNNVNSVGGYCTNMANVAALLGQGSAAVRASCPHAKVVIHLALSTNVNTDTYKWFFDEMKSRNLDYDIIGVSYYPYYTDSKPTILNTLASTMWTRYSKPLLVLETGYSWTQYRPSGRYGGNYEGQLHMNGAAYNEATQAGQKSFMQELNDVVSNNNSILGYLYWDPVMVEQQVNGNWIPTGWVQGGDNQVGNTTWFDYTGKALPIFEAIAQSAATIPETVVLDGSTYIVETEAPLVIELSDAISSGDDCYDTFYDDCGRLIPTSLIASTARKIKSPSMELNPITGNIPANTGVVLKGPEGTYYFWQRSDSTIIENNVLLGTTNGCETPNGAYTINILDGLVGFYPHTGETIAAHKAYYITLTGDVNGDGYITSADITAIYDYLLNGDTSFIATSDVNGDGYITSADITIIYDILLGQ